MTTEKDNQLKDNVLYNLSFFHNDEDILLLYQRIERLAGAIFLVTRLVDDKHVLKATLQEEALMSLKSCSEFVFSTDISSVKLKLVSGHITSLYALLDICFWSGIVSQMNSALIQKELAITTTLCAKIEEKYKNINNPKNSFLALLEKKVSEQNIKDKVKDNTKELIKDNIKDSLNKGQEENIKSPVIHSNNEDRATKIKFLLRDFKPRNIKDIATAFPEVSEKTIQREINKLISEGAVKRIGDRRWSTYLLA